MTNDLNVVNGLLGGRLPAHFRQMASLFDPSPVALRVVNYCSFSLAINNRHHVFFLLSEQDTCRRGFKCCHLFGKIELDAAVPVGLSSGNT